MPRPKKKQEVNTEQPTATTVKRPKFRTAVKNTSFNIFDTESDKQRTKDLMAKAGVGAGFGSSTQSARDYLPVPWLALQYLIGRPGIPMNTITEFIGSESVGKSSLVYALMGEFVAHNIPCFYINSEPKALEPDWQLRLLGTDPVKGRKIRDAIDIQPLNALEEMDDEESEDAAAALAKKLLKRYEREPDERKAMQKLLASMARRGYGYEESREAVEKALDEQR